MSGHECDPRWCVECLQESGRQQGAVILQLRARVAELEESQCRHLALIADMTRNAIDESEAAEMRGQIAALIAEVGRLRAALRSLADEVANTRAWRAAKGMKPCTDTSEFAGATPSVLSALDRAIRHALREEGE